MLEAIIWAEPRDDAIERDGEQLQGDGRDNYQEKSEAL